MRVAYYQQQRATVQWENLVPTGFSCPFNNDDCLHLDSLSMTKTINCIHCENYLQGKKTDNGVNISVLVSEVH